MTGIIPCVFLAVGILCFLYFGRIWYYCGYPPEFCWFWSGGGLIFILYAYFLHLLVKNSETAGFILCLLSLLAGSIILTVFSLIYLFLKKEGNRQAEDGAEYVIVLGAKVNGSVPSKALRSRITTAYDYLMRNKNTKAVLTGGKGRGEDICEALAMERELLNMGLEKERLLIENQSTTTLENIYFAGKMIPDREGAIVIITSDFHTLRGKTIAKEAGFTKVETLGAESTRVMRLHYYTRETLSWILYGIKRFAKNRGRTGEKHE